MKDVEEIKYLTKISSVSLQALTEENKPISSATGCLVIYKDRQFLLTVSHAILTAGKWGLALNYDFDKKGIRYYLPTFQWLVQGRIDKNIVEGDLDFPIDRLIEKPETIDFAYATIPDWVEAVDEYFDLEKGVKYSCPKNVIKTQLNDRPVKNKDYAFCGNVRTDVDEEKRALLSTLQMQLGVKYVGGFNEDYYRFELSSVINDKHDFKGCSGAPILDEDGHLVSLVTNGAEGTKLLLGIRLDKLKLALDVEVNDFS